MTYDERLGAAARSRYTVVKATGLLAIFNDGGVLAPLDVASAEAIARLHGETDERVALAAALTVRGTRFGHVCIRLSTQRSSVAVDGADGMAIDHLPWPEAASWEDVVTASRLVGDGRGDHPLVLDAGRLYLDRYYRYERRVAQLIDDRTSRPLRIIGDKATSTLCELLEVTPTQPTRQLQAAQLALAGGVAVVAGGPGTGKTRMIGATLAALAADDEAFPLTAVCAPTGKAAARLGEELGALAKKLGDSDEARHLASVAPSTIHRLLGWRPGRGRFVHDATNRLPHELVIVDEMSMVSLPLAAKLLEAVRDDATVVLAGDPFQLESIEAGTVLADIVGRASDRTHTLPSSVDPSDDGPPSDGDGKALVPAAPQPSISRHVVVLDQVHRYESGGPIDDLAEAVRSGDTDGVMAMLRRDDDALQWVPDRDSPAFKKLWSTLIDQRARMVEAAGQEGDAAATLEALSEIAVLCARRRGPDGVARWGGDIEAALDERFTGLRWDREWYPGRPVMVTRNDYTLDLYNGDIGVCVQTGPREMRAVFDRLPPKDVPLSHLGEHATVHAMTIHKSQGSQFESVVVVLPGESSPLLTRELLYTAVTRAKRRVYVVAAEPVIRSAVTRTVERASGLGDRLWDREHTIIGT